MSADKEDIRAARRAMNLLTKRGKWGSAPLNAKMARLVSFNTDVFAITGQQGGSRGGGIVFELHHNGQLRLQGLARINWLTEDTSFDISFTDLNDDVRAELGRLYDNLLPDGFKI